MALRRDAGMQIRQSLLIGKPFGLRHKPLDQLQDAVGAVDEPVEIFVRAGASVVGAAFIEPSLGTRGLLGGRQKQQREVIGTLEVSPLLLELRPALGLDQRRNRFGKLAQRIALCHLTAGFDKDCPAGAEAAQRVVEPRRRADQLGRCRGIEVRPAKPRRPLKATVLVENDAGGDQCRPRQEVRKALRLVAILREIEHVPSSSGPEMHGNAHVPTYHFDEIGIAFGGPDCGHVADDPEDEVRRSTNAGPIRSRPRACR